MQAHALQAMGELEGHARRFVANGMGVSADNGRGDGGNVVRVEGLGRTGPARAPGGDGYVRSWVWTPPMRC